MRLDAIPIGEDPPNDVNVVIEVPIGGEPIKYEMNKEAGTLFVDRFLHTPMRYPGNYGFIPHTLCEDGDPMDVLVANTRPIVPGAVMNVRPVGVLKMEDDGGTDEKIIAVPVTLAITFVFSALFYRIVLRRIGVSPAVAVNVVIATLGLSFVLKGIVRNTGFGDVPRSFPAVFGADTVQIGDAVLTTQDVAVFALALLAMAIFFVFFNYTRTGRAMRAVGMNPRAAALVGIDLHKTRMLIWGLSGLLSALAAILIAPKILMTADMGIVVILGFAAAIVGGFTSLPGAVVGGLIIGIVENLVGLFVSTRAIVVAPFIVIMLVLAIRPQGLFGGPVVIKKV